MSNGKDLSSVEQIAACLLYYFQAGLDAHQALADGVRGVSVPSPSPEDLRAVLDSAPITRWKSVLPVAEHLAETAIANAERDPMDVARDVANTVRRGQNFIEKFTGKKGVSELAEQIRRGSK